MPPDFRPSTRPLPKLYPSAHELPAPKIKPPANPELAPDAAPAQKPVDATPCASPAAPVQNSSYLQTTMILFAFIVA